MNNEQSKERKDTPIKEKQIKRRKKKSKTNNLVLFLMLVPGLIVMLINNYIPMFGLVFAFRKMNDVRKLFGSGWNGLKNFDYLFKSKDAWVITRNTIGYNLIFILIGITVPVIIAICLNELRNKRGSKLYQSIYFIPHFLSWTVVSYVAYGLLSNEYGAINNMFEVLGINKVLWYSELKLWPFILVAVNTWKWTGYDTIVYLAAVSGINQELYEAAAVDGASRFQQIINITIPSLVPLGITLVLLRLGRMFYTDMGLFFTVPRNVGILYPATDTIDTYVYRALSITQNVGLSSAAGFYQSILGLIIILTFNALVKKYDKDSAII